MPRFVVSGLDGNHRRQMHRIEAETGAEAVEILKRQGWHQVELVTDAFYAAVETPESVRHRPETDRLLTPEQELKVAGWGFWGQAWLLAKQTKWLLLALGAWIGWRIWMPGPWGCLDGVVVMTLGLWGLFAAFIFWWSGGFSRLVRAGAAGKWEDVLRRIAVLEKSALSSLIPTSELQIRRAHALIGLGRLAEGMAVVEDLERSSASEWVQLTRIADIYVRLRDLAKAKELFERSVELGVGHPEPLLGYAEFLAGWLVQDVVGAREALEKARRLPLAKTVQWAVFRTEGMIALTERRYQTALDHFAKTRDALRLLPDVGLHAGLSAHLAAYEAIALAALGRRDEARKALESSDPEIWLAPHLPELVASARAAVA